MSDDALPFDVAAVREYARLYPHHSAVEVCAHLGIDPTHLDDVRALVDEKSHPTESDDCRTGGITTDDGDGAEPITGPIRNDPGDGVRHTSDSTADETRTTDGADVEEMGDDASGVSTRDNTRSHRICTHDPAEPPDGAPEDTQTTDTTPGVETAEPGDSDATNAREAFAAAIEFYHDRLDDELPDAVDVDTPREYFEDRRGWDPETIDTKRLGYAPPDPSVLLDHLMRRGFDRNAILGTGLFTEDLQALWRGRYVLPYFDVDGRPVYAISRTTGKHGGGAAGYDGHPADIMSGKYAKPAHTKPYAHVEEPIYGLDTIRDGEPVLITEGVADAITAHEAGYPCISPVTTSFKHDDRQALVDALADRDVPRVYIVQDAERPESGLDDDGRLTLSQYGPGLKGAVATGAYLTDHADGLDAHLAELPRPGLDKVDLDDYLREWSDTLDPILASAKPATEHPAYDAKTVAVDTARREQSRSTSADEERDGDSTRSAVFDLDIRDVTGLSWDYRGTNPLGHHGGEKPWSENYFVLIKDHGVAYDHKYSVAYTPLTYLLCDADERRADGPNGELEDNEVFVAWRHAKQQGHIPDDDPIPHRALRHVALDAGLCERTDIEDGWRLPADAYNDALERVRDTHDVDPGRTPLVDEHAEASAPIGHAALEYLADHDAERYRRKRDLDIPSTDDARRELRDAVFREMRAGNDTLLDAPTALGKSYTVATEPWLRRTSVTGDAPVIHLHATTDARDAAAETTERHGAEGAVLKGRKECSPLARGDHDPAGEDDERDPDLVVTVDGRPASEWFDEMCDERGLPFSTALALARKRNDRGLDELPPVGEEDPAVAQWDGIPRDDDGDPAVDVVHATHQFAYVPSLRTYTNVVLDEQPDYSYSIGAGQNDGLSQDRVRRMVTAYLREIDAPVSTFEAFVHTARFESTGDSDAGREQDALGELLSGRAPTPPREWYVDNPDAHALAPDLTRALWQALRWEDSDTNGRRAGKVLHEPPRFDADAGSGYGGTWLSVVVDEENTIQSVRNTPDFSQARSVIGLDAHPSRPMWDLNAVPGMDYDAVLDPTERRLWRRFERGLTVVQVGDATRPRSGKNARKWMNPDRVAAVCRRLRDAYDEDFGTAITTGQVKDDIRRIMADVGVSGVTDDSTMHYGEEKSRNDFADETVGYLYGCMDPGDEMILNALAELGKNATPATERDGDGELHRAKGRGFDGPDADTAAALLASVRENHVAQGAGRYARNPDDPDSRATVYVHTDAAPPGFVDYETPGVEWLATETQREIIDTLADRPNATTQELADAVGVSKEHVRNTLERLAERNLVHRHRGSGEHGADEWDTDENTAAFVDIGPLPETANDPLCESNRWSLAIRRRDDGAATTQAGTDAGTPPTTVQIDADPPPDTAD